MTGTGGVATSVGIVGAGIITEKTHLPVLTAMPEVTVAWVTDLDEGRARALAGAHGVPAVPLPQEPSALPACDVALLATPLRARVAYLEAFASRGTAVLAEKPFAARVEEHRKLLELFEPHRVACGYQRRMYANTALVRALLRGAWLGPARRMRIAEGNRVTHSGVDRTHLDDAGLAGGGVLISLGCHTLDWAFYVCDTGEYELLGSELVFDGDLDRKASARVRLGAAHGPIELDYCVSWLDPQPGRIEIEFDAATVSLGVFPSEPVLLRGRGASGPGAQLVPAMPGATTGNQAAYLEWIAFLEGLETHEPSAVAAAESLPTTALIEDLYRSGAER